jgi:hypothetical protein
MNRQFGLFVQPVYTVESTPVEHELGIKSPLSICHNLVAYLCFAMTFFNNLVKASIAGGVVVGSAVAYAQLNDEQRQKLHSGVNRLRRKVADLIAPDDGVYTIPKEVEAELEALLNNEDLRRGTDDTI